MLMWLATLSAVCLCVASAAQTGAKLPIWIQPCYRDDPLFDKCATEHGQNAIPGLVKGDRKIRLPVMDPLEIVEMKMDSRATHLGLDFAMRNISIFGLSKAIHTGFHADFEKQIYSTQVLMSSLEIIGSYSVAGQILVLPITGTGPGNITLKNVNAKIELYCALKKNPKDGMVYAQAFNSSLIFNTTRGYFKLDNLFNGDKLLGSTMNQFLNDNWQELISSIGPIISDALGEFLQQIFNTVLSIVPYDNVLPKTPQQ